MANYCNNPGVGKTQGKCETMFIEVYNNTRQKVRDWDNGTTGKGSRQQQKEMTADDRKWQCWQELTNDNNQGTSWKLVTEMAGNLGWELDS